jgi:hypothetical protein
MTLLANVDDLVWGECAFNFLDNENLNSLLFFLAGKLIPLDIPENKHHFSLEWASMDCSSVV